MKKLLFIIPLLPIIFFIGCTPSLDTDTPQVATPEETANTKHQSTPALPPTPAPELSPAPEQVTEPDPTPEPSPTPEPPPVFGFIDAHADTISRALLPHNNAGLYSNNLHVDFERLNKFEAPVQVFVLWCADSYVKTAFDRTNLMIDFFEREVNKHSDIIELALDLDDIERIAREGRISAVLAIEGGEALMGNIENLDHFYNRGVRILAPTWNRENELGYGQATGSAMGLKPFGIECIQRMDELGMIMDVSHLNEAGFWDAHNTATRPYMASHSNAYAVFPHNRNLRDDQILAIVKSGGIIGFNMFPQIVAPNSQAAMDDVMAHFNHFIQLGAVKHLGLGCDFDGIPSTPAGITDVSSLKAFGALLAAEFDDNTSHRIMEGNFYEFFKRYFKG